MSMLLNLFHDYLISTLMFFTPTIMYNHNEFVAHTQGTQLFATGYILVLETLSLSTTSHSYLIHTSSLSHAGSHMLGNYTNRLLHVISLFQLTGGLWTYSHCSLLLLTGIYSTVL